MSQLPGDLRQEGTRKAWKRNRIWRWASGLAAAGLAAAVLTAPPAAASSHQASDPLVVNPLYQQAFNVGFGGLAPFNTRALYSKTTAVTPDQGIVMIRAFIPSTLAAGGLLFGDGRGFSAMPAASSRGVIAWNTNTGQVSLTMTHSLSTAILFPSPPSPPTMIRPALPVVKLPYNGDFRDDAIRLDNEIGIAPSTPGNLAFRMSLLNPLTNIFAPWSVDYLITITRKGPGSYQFKQFTGNGYPAIEAYYYPKFIPAGSRQQSSVIGKRAVDPLFLGLPADPGGGVAALDALSWNVCRSLSGSLTVRCTNTVPYAQAILSPLAALITRATGLPSRAQWMAPWDTPANATNAGAGD